MQRILSTIIIFLLVVVFLQNPAFGESYKNFIVPTATIAIDGNKIDWNNIQPAFADQVNDQPSSANFNGTDLENFYIAKDNQFFYFMMELFDGDPKSDIGTQYLFEANTIFNETRTIGDRFGGPHYNPPNSSVNVAEYVSDGLNGLNSFPASYLGAGIHFIEWKIPQLDFGSIDGKFIQTWIHVDGESVSDYDRTNVRIIYQGGTISGALTNSDGLPIQDAIVEASTKCGDLFFESSPTDANGNFSIPLEAGSYYISYEAPESDTRYWYKNGSLSPICDQASAVNVTTNSDTSNIDLSIPPMRIELWYVQNRKYEDGREFNKVNFAMKDEANNYILEEVLASMELYDPDGNMIQPTSSGYGNPYKTVAGGYDANNGRWYFGDSFYDENYYYINFNAPLKMGNYHLIVTDNSGNQYEAYQYFDSVKSIPQISSETICAFKDNEGNLFWKWEIPSEKFLNVSTSIRTWVDGFSADRSLLGEIYMKVPTHMGWAFVPANLLQQLEQLNPAVLEIGLHVRSNDNNNRYYTNNLNWEEANACGCDVNADQKTGLIEAIHALQVVAGVR